MDPHQPLHLIRFEPRDLSQSAPSPLERSDIHLWILRAETLKNFPEKRAALKQVLSYYTQIAPQHLQFDLKGEGKPHLKSEQNPTGLHFNLSHSKDTQIVAVTRLGEIGVDIEQIRVFKRLEPFVERFFFPSEKKRIEAAPPSKRVRVFFTIWTAKEAWAKARGKSIFGALTHFEYSAEDPNLQPLEMGTDYVGHIAINR